MRIKHRYSGAEYDVTGKTEEGLGGGDIPGVDPEEWPFYLIREEGNGAIEFYSDNYREMGDKDEYVTIKIKAEDWAEMDTRDECIYPTRESDGEQILVDYIKVEDQDED